MYINGILQAYLNRTFQDYGSNLPSTKSLSYARMNGILRYDGSIVAGPMIEESNDVFINGILQDDDGAAIRTMSTCKSNKKLKAPPFQPQGTDRRFSHKVAINSIGVRTNSGEVTGSYATPEGYGGPLPLTW